MLILIGVKGSVAVGVVDLFIPTLRGRGGEGRGPTTEIGTTQGLGPKGEGGVQRQQGIERGKSTECIGKWRVMRC